MIKKLIKDLTLKDLDAERENKYLDWIEKYKEYKEPMFSMPSLNLYLQCKSIIKKYVCSALSIVRKMMNLSAFVCSCLTTIMIYNWKFLFLSNYVELTQRTFVAATIFLLLLIMYLVLYATRELLHEKTYE